jgi:antitoxin component HigA of HigAB toxin-antitoxin module
MALPTRFPLFIVGSPRSGTSILVDALRSAGYYGFNEGNYLSCLHTIDQLIDRHFGIFDVGSPKVLVSQISKSALKAALYKAVCQAAELQYGNRPWVDKTGNPEMIAAIPILLEVWPTSHFIFAKRRAIENVISRLRKFPNHTFDYHCADWARNMAAWRLLRAGALNIHAIEVDQFEISQMPDEVATRIAQFLDLGHTARAQIAGLFASERPQQTEVGSAQRILTLERTGWIEQQLRTFHTRCDEEMCAYGYTTDETYWSQASRSS